MAKTFKDYLECDLTAAELAERSKQAADTQLKLRETETEKKRIDQKLGSEIKLLQQEVDRLATIVSKGKERRDVECTSEIDWNSFRIRYIRLDTGEVYRERDLTEDERQSNLFNEPPPHQRDPEPFQKEPGREVAKPEESTDKADEFTAEQCEECKRIDGAHTAECSKGGAIEFSTYLAFVKAHDLKPFNTNARKLQLSKERDAEVKAWMEQEKSVPPDASEVNAGSEDANAAAS
jgi:hypothetical protein